MRVFIFALLILNLSACKSDESIATSPTLPNDDSNPCSDCSQIDKTTYPGYYIASTSWLQELDPGVADLSSPGLIQSPGHFFMTNDKVDPYFAIIGVNQPTCGDGYDRDQMFLYMSDDWDSKAFKFVHVQSNNRVHIYSYNPTFSMSGSTATIDSELVEAWDCEGGVLTRKPPGENQEFLAVNEAGFGYLHYKLFSGPLFEISMSATPSDISSLNSFNVFFDWNGYSSTSDFVNINSGSVNPVFYDTSGTSDDVNSTALYNTSLGNKGKLGYIFRASETTSHRSSFIVIKGLEDVNNDPKNLLMGIFDSNTIVEDTNATTTQNIFGMSP